MTPKPWSQKWLPNPGVRNDPHSPVPTHPPKPMQGSGCDFLCTSNIGYVRALFCPLLLPVVLHRWREMRLSRISYRMRWKEWLLPPYLQHVYHVNYAMEFSVICNVLLGHIMLVLEINSYCCLHHEIQKIWMNYKSCVHYVILRIGINNVVRMFLNNISVQ